MQLVLVDSIRLMSCHVIFVSSNDNDVPVNWWVSMSVAIKHAGIRQIHALIFSHRAGVLKFKVFQVPAAAVSCMYGERSNSDSPLPAPGILIGVHGNITYHNQNISQSSLRKLNSTKRV